MELNELVAAMVPSGDSTKCPFEHEPVEHKKKNVVPPPKTANDASVLSSNLDAASLGVPPTEIELPNGDRALAQFTAHHLVPGNESWPKSKLYRWIDKRKGHVKGDIGYDVNGYRNGVDLPGHTPIGNWTARSPRFRSDYAFASMRAAGGTRQFHDRHAAYSDFVVQVLNKIAAPLDARVGGSAGCGEDECPGNKKKKPFDPPYNVLPRLYALAQRLQGRLTGGARGWQKPIITSRFALMYKVRLLTEDAARDALRKVNFTY